jgi:hypothetical protein
MVTAQNEGESSMGTAVLAAYYLLIILQTPVVLPMGDAKRCEAAREAIVASQPMLASGQVICVASGY